MSSTQRACAWCAPCAHHKRPCMAVQVSEATQDRAGTEIHAICACGSITPGRKYCAADTHMMRTATLACDSRRKHETRNSLPISYRCLCPLRLASDGGAHAVFPHFPATHLGSRDIIPGIDPESPRQKGNPSALSRPIHANKKSRPSARAPLWRSKYFYDLPVRRSTRVQIGACRGDNCSPLAAFDPERCRRSVATLGQWVTV